MCQSQGWFTRFEFQKKVVVQTNVVVKNAGGSLQERVALQAIFLAREELCCLKQSSESGEKL